MSTIDIDSYKQYRGRGSGRGWGWGGGDDYDNDYYSDYDETIKKK